jgi:hypothetical protein
MDTINTYMLVLLTVVAVLYAGYAMYFMMRESRRADGDGKKKRQTASPSEEKRHKADIMGKSHFVLQQGVSRPQAAKAVETESNEKKGDTFAPEEVPHYPRQIAPEELDEVFGNVPEGETNEPLEIDQPLYVEPPFPEEEADDDEEDENEELPLTGRHSAQGVSYENLGEAYRRVVHNPIITEREKEETGRVLLDLKHTDMFEYIVSGSSTREDRVLHLIDTYLAAFQKRMSTEAAESPSSPMVAPAPAGFDLRDYV